MTSKLMETTRSNKRSTDFKERYMKMKKLYDQGLYYWQIGTKEKPPVSAQTVQQIIKRGTKLYGS